MDLSKLSKYIGWPEKKPLDPNLEKFLVKVDSETSGYGDVPC